MSEWTDIGEQLRKARENKGLELRDVAHTTRIPLATLEALEESDYSVFPSPTYARSFLSQYSEFLDVDAHEWIDAFETGDVLSNVNDHGYLQEHHDHIGDHNPQTEGPRKRNSPSRSRDEKSSSNGGASILQTLTVFLVTALLIAGGIYAYKKYEPMLSGALSEEEADPTDQNSAENSGTSDSSEPTDSDKSTKVAKTETTGTPSTETSPKPTNGDSSSKPKPEIVQTPKEVAPKPRTGPPPKALVIDEEEE